MPTRPASPRSAVARAAEPRTPITAERIVEAAVAVADRGGLGALSMRHVGAELGVEAMSLYHHVANKEALLDALADWAFTEIRLPLATGDWRSEMVARCSSARAVLTAHPWAVGLLESRGNPGPAVLRQHDAVLGCLFAGGFPTPLAAHAFSVLDAYVYGFAVTEANLPFPNDGGEDGGDAEAFVAEIGPALAEYPHLARLVTEHVVGRRYAFGDEFAVGLDLILDGLERELELTRGG